MRSLSRLLKRVVIALAIVTVTIILVRAVATRRRTGKSNVVALPISPGLRGKRVSSSKIPMASP